MTRRAVPGAGLLVLAAVAAMRSSVAATGGGEVPDLVRFPAEIRALLPLADGALVAGILPGERAYAARLDERFEIRWQRRFEDCGRCGFLDAGALEPGRAVLVGYRDAERGGREDGLVTVLDLVTGETLSERTVLTPSGGRLWAVDIAAGQVFAAGEAWTHAGAGLDAWILALRRGDLAPLREWYHGGPLPDASSDVVAAGDDAVAAGWTFSATGGRLGGWIARFGTEPRPLWRHDNADDPTGAFDVAAIAPLADGGWLAAGQTSTPDRATGALALDLRFARFAADGTLLSFGGFDDAGTDRMVVDILPAGRRTAAGHLAVVAARPHPDGPDTLELVAIDPDRAAAEPRFVWRDGTRATVPDTAVFAADGTLLVAGWYRDPAAGDPTRGWLARFPRTLAATGR